MRGHEVTNNSSYGRLCLFLDPYKQGLRPAQEKLSHPFYNKLKSTILSPLKIIKRAVCIKGGGRQKLRAYKNYFWVEITYFSTALTSEMETSQLVLLTKHN
jgi:hypothetical protein